MWGDVAIPVNQHTGESRCGTSETRFMVCVILIHHSCNVGHRSIRIHRE